MYYIFLLLSFKRLMVICLFSQQMGSDFVTFYIHHRVTAHSYFPSISEETQRKITSIMSVLVSLLCYCWNFYTNPRYESKQWAATKIRYVEYPVIWLCDPTLSLQRTRYTQLLPLLTQSSLSELSIVCLSCHSHIGPAASHFPCLLVSR